MNRLFEFAQPGWRGATYDDSTALFARGEAAMMMQGIWALSPVRRIVTIQGLDPQLLAIV